MNTHSSAQYNNSDRELEELAPEQQKGNGKEKEKGKVSPSMSPNPVPMVEKEATTSSGTLPQRVEESLTAMPKATCS